MHPVTNSKNIVIQGEKENKYPGQRKLTIFIKRIIIIKVKHVTQGK